MRYIQFMRLSSFSYKDICRFSQTLTDVIKKLEHSQLYKLMAESPAASQTDIAASQVADVLQYWEEPFSNTNINYGRDLIIQKNGTSTKFWLGLDITRTRVRFIVWFEEPASSKVGILQYMQKLDTAVNNSLKQQQNPITTTNHVPVKYAEPPESSAREYWVTMDDQEFTDFCDPSTSSNPNKLEEFIKGVLANL